MIRSRQFWYIGSVLSVLVFLGLVHTLHLMGEISNIKSTTTHSIKKISHRMSKALSDQDLFEVNRLLRLIKDDRLSSVKFRSEYAGVESLRGTFLGALDTESALSKNFEVPVNHSGASLGTLGFQINVGDLSWSLVSRYSYVYLLVAVAFLALLILPQLASIRTFRWIESYLSSLVGVCRQRKEKHVIDLLEERKASLAQDSRLAHGQLIQLISTLVDLMKVEELYAHSKAREGLARQVAHDIRSPISLIRAYANSQRSHGNVAFLEKAADRIEGVAEDLLKETRQNNQYKAKEEEGPPQTSSHLAELELDEIIASLIAEKKQSNPDVEFGRYGSNCIVKGNIAYIERVVSNLLQNAVEAVEGCEKKMVTVSIEEEAWEVRIDIRDSGIGISEEVVAQIAQNSEVTTKVYGNGLGLTGSRRLLELMNGRLKIFSDGVRGTTVSVWMPSAGSSRSHQ